MFWVTKTINLVQEITFDPHNYITWSAIMFTNPLIWDPFIISSELHIFQPIGRWVMFTRMKLYSFLSLYARMAYMQ